MVKLKLVIIMAFDGVFIHYLINEIKPIITNKRINKIISISDTDYVFILQNKIQLLISVSSNNSHFRFTDKEFVNSNTSMSSFLKKHIESGIITNLAQHNNDRIVFLDITSKDDLGYLKEYKIILELTGRFANMIITDNDFIILEALKKSYLTDERVILPKAKYEFLESNKVSPFLNLDYTLNQNCFEGVSNLLFTEFNYNGSVRNVLNRQINPVIIKSKKILFYVFNLQHIEGERIEFDSISRMLDYYFTEILHENNQNNEQKKLETFINKEIAKLQNKLSKQVQELQVANDGLELEKVANVLASNIHNVKPYQESVILFNFYTGEDITIKLNTNISVNENVNYYFNKFKKAKRTIINLTSTIEQTKDDIKYYELLLTQMDSNSINDLREILYEVGISKPANRKQKPSILKYKDNDGNEIFVGKNNIQNEYLTFTLANPNDYFFHVASYPGSHVILRGSLNKETIKLASTIAAYYSKAKGSVSVDYTLVKWVKKIKGMKGSFVRYTNQKSEHVIGDIEYINTHATLQK